MLFIHDHTFVTQGERFYTTGSLNQRVMDRYKSWFGQLSVFATTRAAGAGDRAFVRAENEVTGIDFHLVKKGSSPAYLVRSYRALRRAVAGADCVVIRMFSVLGVLGALCARKQRKPYMIEMCSCPWDSLWYHSLKGKLAAPVMTLLTKRICRRAPRVLYVSSKFLQRRYPSRGKSIGCSDVELAALDGSVPAARDARLARRPAGEPLKLGTLANVAVKYKGQDIVIRALRELAEAGIPCEYYLIGGGDPRRLRDIAARAGVAARVHMVDPVPHEEIFAWLDQLDVYVQPSRSEALSRAAIEAMGRGCPVVGAAAGGIPELIAGDMVFRKGSRRDFIRVMKSLDGEKLRHCARENYRRAQDFDKGTLDARRAAFYEAFARGEDAAE